MTSIYEVGSDFRTEIGEMQQALIKNANIFEELLTVQSDKISNEINEKENNFKEIISKYNNELSLNEIKLNNLKNKYMEQEKDSVKYEEKVNEIKNELNELNKTKLSSLPNSFNETEKNKQISLKKLHEKKLKLRNMILKHEKKIKNFLNLCNLYENNFGIKCYVDNHQNNSIKIIFNQINPKRSAATHYYEGLCHWMHNNIHQASISLQKAVKLQPAIEQYRNILHVLNSIETL